MNDEFNKFDQLCEGVDNLDRVHRHFEKTLVDKYKARQAQMQQNVATAINNIQIPQGSQNTASSSGLPQNPNSGHHSNTANQNSRSATLNDGKKKGNAAQKSSMTFFDANSTNIKHFDSNVLHFSTTYDNTNSSALTLPDDSMDSIDELNSNQQFLNLDFILLPENVVYFKILDLFSVVSEKIHETLCTKFQHSFETEKASEELLNYSEVIVPNLQPRPKVQSEKEKLFDGSDLFSQYPGDDSFKIFIKGLYTNPSEDGNAKVAKKRANVFLHKFEKKINWILNQVDMNSVFFYDMEIEQLGILDSYLAVNTSKITVFEIIDSLFESLLLIKKQIIDLSAGFLSNQGTNVPTTRVVSPNLTAKAHRLSSTTKDLPTPSAPSSSTNIVNSALRPFLKINPSSRVSNINAELSPQKTIEFSENFRGRSISAFTSPFANSFIFRQRELFFSYLGIITKLIYRTPKLDMYTLLNEVYISNESWSELVKLFAVSTFREITTICDRFEDSNQATIDKEQILLFSNAKKILDYYTSVLVMCNITIHKEKLHASPSDPSKKKWKNIIRKILQSMMYLVKPNNGLLTSYISINTNINSLIINPKIQSLSNYNLIRIHLFKCIFDMLRKIFSFTSRFSCFLGDEISTFYIRFSYINFVKLYSHSSNSELNEINRKIVEVGTRVKGKNAPENITEDIDRLEDEFYPGSAGGTNNELKAFQINLSKLYMKILLAISKNRTDEIKHKFYQFRILEFFTREIDLEFDVNLIFMFFITILS